VKLLAFISIFKIFYYINLFFNSLLLQYFLSFAVEIETIWSNITGVFFNFPSKLVLIRTLFICLNLTSLFALFVFLICNLKNQCF
jgi:hypothetical protein